MNIHISLLSVSLFLIRIVSLSFSLSPHSALFPPLISHRFPFQFSLLLFLKQQQQQWRQQSPSSDSLRIENAMANKINAKSKTTTTTKQVGVEKKLTRQCIYEQE